MADLGYPFQGDIWYWVESTYAGGVSGATFAISDAVQNVRIDTGEINKALKSISEPTVIDFSKTLVDPTLHIEWVLQPTTHSLATLCTGRINDCDLESMCFEIATNLCRSTSTYYLLEGCKCKSITVSASQGENYMVSADFSVATITVSDTKTGVKPSAIGTDYAAFNVGGSITWNGVTGAYVTKSLSVTVNNNISDLYNVGDYEKVGAIPGAKDVTGTCDISLDGGGGTHFSEVIGGTDITSVEFNTGIGTSSDGKLTLVEGRFDSTSVALDVGGEAMMTSVPFTFKDLSWGAGS